VTYCAYCLRPHERDSRCCSQWCSRRVAGKLAWITRSRRQAVNDVLAREQRLHRNDRRWRDVTMGRNEAGQLAVIFGLDLPLGMSRR